MTRIRKDFKIPKILTLDATTGMPNKWVHWKKACGYHYSDKVVASIGEYTFSFHGGESRMTGQTVVIETSSIIMLKGHGRLPKNYHSVPKFNGRDPSILFKRDKHTCVYCNEQFSEDHLSMDHIFPDALGGTRAWTNMITACKPCNNKKGMRTPEEAGMKMHFKPRIPSRIEYLLFTSDRILPDQRKMLEQYL